MTATDTPQKLRKAPLFTPYEVMWSTVGALSLGVLLVLGLAPEWLDDLRPASTIVDPQSNQGQRAAARLTADVNTLKQSVAQVQLDLAQVKTDVANHGEQQKSVSAQLSSLEARLGASSGESKVEALATPPSDSTLPAEPPAAAQPQTIRGYVTSNDKIDATSPAAPVVTSLPVTAAANPVQTAAAPHAAKVINADAATQAPALETGSVGGAPKPASQAISFGPAVVKPAPKPVGVKISSGPSVDSLRLSWTMLAEQHSDTLKSMEARYVTSGDAQNPTYDLVAGPLKSKAEAAKVCKALAAKGVPCTVGAFKGESL